MVFFLSFSSVCGSGSLSHFHEYLTIKMEALLYIRCHAGGKTLYERRGRSYQLQKHSFYKHFHDPLSSCQTIFHDLLLYEQEKKQLIRIQFTFDYSLCGHEMKKLPKIQSDWAICRRSRCQLKKATCRIWVRFEERSFACPLNISTIQTLDNL